MKLFDQKKPKTTTFQAQRGGPAFLPSYLALCRAILMAVLPYHHSLTGVYLDKLSPVSMLKKQDGNKVIKVISRQSLPLASIPFLKRIGK